AQDMCVVGSNKDNVSNWYAACLSEHFRPPRKKGPFSAHSCSTSFGFCGLFHVDCLTVRIESSADSDLLSFMRLHQILAVDVIARAASVLQYILIAGLHDGPGKSLRLRLL